MQIFRTFPIAAAENSGGILHTEFCYKTDWKMAIFRQKMIEKRIFSAQNRILPFNTWRSPCGYRKTQNYGVYEEMSIWRKRKKHRYASCGCRAWDIMWLPKSCAWKKIRCSFFVKCTGLPGTVIWSDSIIPFGADKTIAVLSAVQRSISPKQDGRKSSAPVDAGQGTAASRNNFEIYEAKEEEHDIDRKIHHRL